MATYICNVCGYDNLTEAPWGEDGKTPTYYICPCCGVEFGYEDATKDALEKYRKNWISLGADWFDVSKKPGKWELKEQLKNLNK